MVRELLRRPLMAVLSSDIAEMERRLSALDVRLRSLETGKTHIISELWVEVEDMHAQIQEWAGVRGFSQNE